MKFKVYTPEGESSGEKDFDAPFFSAFVGDDGEPSEKGLQALRQVLIAYVANRRQGTQSTKTRAEVAGTGKKPWRQKGTGMARHGSRRSPIWRTGGVAHGPKPRDWGQKIPRRMKQLALQRALFDRAHAGEIGVIEQFTAAEKPKTKPFATMIEKIAPAGKVLIVDDVWADNAALSARNVERVILCEARSVNAYDLSRYDRIIITEKGIATLLARAQGGEA